MLLSAKGAFAKFKKAVTSHLGSHGNMIQEEIYKISHEWEGLDEDMQEAFQEVFSVTAENLETFTKVKKEPEDAFAAAATVGAATVELLAYASPMAGRAPLFLVAMILGSFGENEDLQDVIKGQVEELYLEEMKGRAVGWITKFQRSQSFLSSFLEAQDRTKDDLDFLTRQIKILDGIEFMGMLFNDIVGMVREDENEDGEGFFQHLELYTRLLVMKDLMLQQTVAVLPASMKVSKMAVMKEVQVIRNSFTTWLADLFQPKIDSKLLPWFDPNEFPVTSAYLNSNLENFVQERPMAGTYHILPSSRDRRRFNSGALGWTASRVAHNYPSSYTQAQPSREAFEWRLVSFGENLFTIKSRHGCPDDSRCNYFLGLQRAFRKFIPGVRNFVVLKSSEPTLWEIVKVTGNRYR